jgi:toxin CptA
LALPLSGLVLLSLLWQWRKQPALNQLQCLPDGQFEVQTWQGETLAVQLENSSVLTAQVLILHFAHPQRRFYVLLWPDSADAEVRRQWRVYLRWVWPEQSLHDLNSIESE